MVCKTSIYTSTETNYTDIYLNRDNLYSTKMVSLPFWSALGVAFSAYALLISFFLSVTCRSHKQLAHRRKAHTHRQNVQLAHRRKAHTYQKNVQPAHKKKPTRTDRMGAAPVPAAAPPVAAPPSAVAAAAAALACCFAFLAMILSKAFAKDAPLVPSVNFVGAVCVVCVMCVYVYVCMCV
jgi:hypothetical protein